ncbi:MAG: hypothetical protein ACM3SW_17000 [Actinomycetota bacterium]
MARGWESKQVESQIDDAREKHATPGTEASPDDPNAEREKQNLLLSRAYIRHQIESSANARYTESLNKALEEIERKLSGLSGK